MNSADYDDLPAEIDFAKGIRGKLHGPGQRLHLPVYLADQLQTRLTALASARGVELSVLVNDLLRKNLERIDIAAG